MAAYGAPPCGLLSWNTRVAIVAGRPAPGSWCARPLPVTLPPTTALSGTRIKAKAETSAVPADVPRLGATGSAPAAAVTVLHSARELVAALSAFMSTPGVVERVSVVKFHTPSCRSCAGVRVKYERMAAAYATMEAKHDAASDHPLEEGAGQPSSAAVACYTMDVSDHAELCAHLGIDRLPYFMVVRGGRRVFARDVGWNRFDDVRAAVDAAVRAEVPTSGN
ncbi:hypothetical protein MMPV_006695 [Pyropia vietnamensis]